MASMSVGEEEEEEEEEVDSEDDESYRGGEDGEEEDEEDDDMDEEEGGLGMMIRAQPVDLNEKDNFNCTALHVAIHARQLEAMRVLLEAGASVVKKTEGSTPLHTALAVGSLPQHRAFALEATQLLLEKGADANVKDDCNYTPLHLAAFHGLTEFVELLLSHTGSAGESFEVKDRIGNRPLHLAAKQGHAETLTALLSGCMDTDAALKAGNLRGMTPLHYACLGAHWPCAKYLLGQDPSLSKSKDKQHITAGQMAVRAGHAIPDDLKKLLGLFNSSLPPSSSPSSPSPTLLIADPTCLEHHTCTPIIRATHCDPPPENVHRLKVLLDPDTGILHSREFTPCPSSLPPSSSSSSSPSSSSSKGKVEWCHEAPEAPLADLLRVHDFDYLRRIQRVCASLPPSPHAIGHLDGDTAVSRASWTAALRAAGATCLAVDRVVAQSNRNAFCAVRPPGHHAGSRGVVKCDPSDQGSHGFCLINNVAVAAAYARHVYRHQGIKKVAIVDFDVHHG